MTANGEKLCLETASEAETKGVAADLAALLRPGDVVLLVGELGSGKTRFIQGLAEGLGVRERVLSPTFTLLRHYRGRLPLDHMDAYRLEGPHDLFELGIEEYLGGDGVLVVEWGDRVREFFTGDRLEVEMRFTEDDERRVITFRPYGISWEDRLLRFRKGQGATGRPGRERG